MAEYLEIAAAIAREAGALIADYHARGIGFELKGDFDLVTEADRASEKLIVERLKTRFPEHGILAEEGSGHESPSEYRWYVDPLDGTTNFAHGYPVYNVTLGLEKAGEMIAGVIFDPSRDELFSCV
jgi:myo-inositol-1(or 4)-monophosphatase